MISSRWCSKSGALRGWLQQGNAGCNVLDGFHAARKLVLVAWRFDHSSFEREPPSRVLSKSECRRETCPQRCQIIPELRPM